MKYIKKPIPVEAFQYNGDLVNGKRESYVPDFAITAHKFGILFYKNPNDFDPPELYIKTLEGDMHCSVGDYIIKGIHGELYACNKEIFEETYEPVKE